MSLMLKLQKLIHLYDAVILFITKWFTDIFLLLVRVYAASLFFGSGWNKLSNLWDGGWFKTVFLFQEVHPVPFLSPEVAAVLGTGAEVLFAVLLAFGLFGRLGALGLLGVTATITFGVHSHFTHVYWAFLLGVSFIFGPGKLSVDAWLEYVWDRFVSSKQQEATK